MTQTRTARSGRQKGGGGAPAGGASGTRHHRSLFATDGRGPHYAAGPALTLNGPVQTQLAVGPVDDPYERQADAVARRVAASPAAAGPMQRQPVEDEQVQPLVLRRQVMEEEEPVQRQPLEDEPVQRLILRRQVMEEERPVQRQPKEEEPLQPLPIRRQVVEEEPIQRQQEEEEPLQRQPEEEEPVQPSLIRRQAMTEEEPVQRQAEEEEVQRQPEEEPVQASLIQRQTAMEEEPIRRAANGRPHVSATTASTIHSPGAGRPLQPGVRRRIEPRLGADLGHVRVHSGASAGRAAAGLGARAFTHRHHIFLGSHESSSDLRLMAHEATHVVQQQAAPVQTAPQVQRLFDFSLDDIPGIDAADIARRVPGYTLFTVIIGYNPLTGTGVDRSAINLLQGLMELVPFGADIFDALNERGIIQDAFAWVQQELSRLDLSTERITRVLDEAWEELDLFPPFSIAENLDIIVRKFGALYNDVVAFARSLVNKIMEMIKEAALDLAEEFLEENRAWDLIKKILGRDPLRDEPVDATPTEILEDFLLLIGKEQHLEQMRERGTVEQTANWLATQIETFMSLLGELGGLISSAWEAIQPENLPNLATNLRDLATRVGGFLQRVWDFASTVAAEVLQLIKDALLGWLSDVAHELPGFHLLTVIIERNPFTGDRVPRTAENLIRGFITLLPGGAGIYAQLVETGTIAGAAARIEAAMAELGISWEFVVGLFTGIWENITIEALAQPLDTFARIVAQFGEPISRLVAFVNVVLREIFFIILEIMHFPSDLIGSIISNAMQAIADIRNDPIGFLLNMLRAVKQGFASFFGNILTHLVGGLADWLFRGLRDAGIEPPTDLSLQSVLDFVLQVLGISMERIWEKLAERIGQETVDRIRGAIDRLTGIWNFVRDVQERGVAAIWEYIESQISGLWSMVLEQATQWIMERIINRAIQWLLSLLDPTGIMPVINSFIAFFKAVQSAIEYLRDILEIINDYVSTIASVARGAIEPGAQKLEQGLANAIPIAIGFLANQFGLGNIGEKIQEIVAAIREVVDRALDWLLDQAQRALQGLMRMLGFGGEEEEGDVDPSDREAFARYAAGLIKDVPQGDYESVRVAAERLAAEKEPQLSARLPEGIGLRYVFEDRRSDEGDEELDFRVVIAPNTTTYEDKIELEVAGMVVTIWVVSDQRIRLSLDPEDPEFDVVAHREASPERILSDVMGLSEDIDRHAAQAFIDDLNARGILRSESGRSLFISFAQAGPGDPVEYLRENLKLGRSSRAARQVPTGSERHLLVDRGVESEGEQRQTLANYASVFWESYVGQFVSRQVQPDPSQGGITAIEFVFEGQGQPQVRNLGIVRVGEDGAIEEIVQITSEVESVEEFMALMRRARWTVRLG